VVGAIAWFTAVGPQLSNVSAFGSQTTAAQDQNVVLQAKLRKLQADNANLAGLTSDLKDSQAQLPRDSGLPDFTRQLATEAAASIVTITGINAGAPTAVAAAAAAPAAGDATASDGKAAAPAAVTAAGKLFALLVTVISTGTALHLQEFLNKIQQNGPRRALLQSAQFTPAGATGSGSIDAGAIMTVQLQVFVAPQSAAAEAQLQKQLNTTN
jgi:hypothetical protein